MDASLVADCFDLTPAEPAIAVTAGVSRPTVRTHLQRVMEKTGVARQTDLVRLLSELPLNVG